MRLLSPAVVLCDPKYPHNVAAAIRACSCYGVPTLMFTGDRVRYDTSLRERLPREERMKGYKDVKVVPTQRPFDLLPGVGLGELPFNPVCVEIVAGSEPLDTFEHPANPVYVFGPEDGSVPKVLRKLTHRFVHIPAYHCLNLAAAVNVVLYDRLTKLRRDGIEPRLPANQMIKEKRGEISVPGWEGK